MQKKTVADIDVAGKRVFLRVDFNVPMNGSGAISDDSRIQACLPTIKYLTDHNARIIICSHLGRPDGRVVEELRLAPIAERLSELIGRPVASLSDSIGPDVAATVADMKGGDIVLLENIRFYPEEEANDTEFARSLAKLAEVFVNDAFGASHRAHASVVGMAKCLPAVSGFLMEREIEALSQALEEPARPFATLIGGAKVSGKLGVLENIVNKVDSLLIGGGMAATFLKSMGYNVNTALVEMDRLDYARQLMTKAESLNVRLLLPKDAIIAQKLEAGAVTRTVPVTSIPDGWRIADIGPDTIKEFSEELSRCRTIVWNGPVGIFEIPLFAEGTHRLARLMAGLEAATTIIGGGSTAEAVAGIGLVDRMSHVSTGGGASLEFLEGKVLPGVAVLHGK